MREIPLTVSRRSETGKGAARRSRREGLIPGIVYGPEIEPFQVAVTESDLRTAVRAAVGTTSIFNLSVDGQETKVLLRELQRDPVTSHVVHVDFHAISMNKPIHLRYPIHFVGMPVGVKAGGIQQIIMRELEILCLPTNIPDKIEVDVTPLEIGEAVHVRDIDLGDVEIVSDPQRAVVVISAPTVIKSVEAEEGEEAEGEEAEGEEAEGAEGEEGEAKEGGEGEEKE